jgi:hypothetical protein
VKLVQRPVGPSWQIIRLRPHRRLARAVGARAPVYQCTNVLTSEKAISPDLAIDQTRHAHSPRVDQS